MLPSFIYFLLETVLVRLAAETALVHENCSAVASVPQHWERYKQQWFGRTFSKREHQLSQTDCISSDAVYLGVKEIWNAYIMILLCMY